MKDLNALLHSQAIILIDELPVLVEGLVGDGNSASDFLPEITRKMRQSSQVHIRIDHVDAICAILTNGSEVARGVRSKELAPAGLRSWSTWLENNLCLAFAQIGCHGVRSAKV
jgi:hypothetical protein